MVGLQLMKKEKQRKKKLTKTETQLKRNQHQKLKGTISKSLSTRFILLLQSYVSAFPRLSPNLNWMTRDSHFLWVTTKKTLTKFHLKTSAHQSTLWKAIREFGLSISRLTARSEMTWLLRCAPS